MRERGAVAATSPWVAIADYRDPIEPQFGRSTLDGGSE